ncbi:alpha/beta hydrolase [Brasilonema octagenarum UFV-E1]|uniref:Alpha/beta hydrolase n=2 Tax=Brasilonema TaxID=383614 RepID=A0A856MNK6_9CYAN|nr:MULTISPECIES: alpha/beta hydrolase [Brasilonema]NMF67396.1 alpha/beta hydrolase [Brasilonema octagenarum UFV-OR1]QDL10837.1 alpha/beta hydrolase [Brasilonema sennae CENA114]QDL17182.1 alpha/beta hydrolase [Brasilonema octagenarum UFV-E1]
MFLPPGFGEKYVMTTLGRMVYYTAVGKPWSDTNVEQSSEKTLVFLHAFGGGSSAYEWSKVYPAFAADYRIVAPDLIGWGRSDHPARSYSVNDYIQTIIEFIERTCNGPISAIASSLTAAFTIRAAILRPDLFKSLILTTPAGLAEFGQDYSKSLSAQIVNIPVVDRLLYMTGVSSSFGIRSFLEERQFARPERVYPEIVEAYLQSAQQFNGEYAALAFVRGDLSFDLSQYITQLTIPTAMIWGQKSEFTGPEIGRRLADMNPQAVRIFYNLEDVGLTPQLELPAVTIGLIRKFLPLLESSV